MEYLSWTHSVKCLVVTVQATVHCMQTTITTENVGKLLQNYTLQPHRNNAVSIDDSKRKILLPVNWKNTINNKLEYIKLGTPLENIVWLTNSSGICQRTCLLSQYNAVVSAMEQQ